MAAINPEPKWFVARHGQAFGPFSDEAVKREAISPQTLVWRKGMVDWAPVTSTELAEIIFGVPPELPPPIPGGAIERVCHSAPKREDNRAEPIPSAPEINPGKRRSYIAAHWAGQHSIGRSYWINNVSISTLLLMVLWPVSFVVGSSDIELETLAFASLATIGSFLTLFVWQFVGLVRSTIRRQSAFGFTSGVFWGWLGVSVLIIGSWVSGSQTLFPMAGGFVQIIQGDLHMPPLQVRVLEGGKAVEIAGGIQSGSAKKVLAVLRANPSAEVLHIDSLGGRIREALKIAKYVKNRGMITYVPRRCMSAATLIMAGGSKRYVEPDAKVGFHAGAFPGLTAVESKRSNSEPIAFLSSVGVDADFLKRAYSTSHDSMWVPSASELIDAKVITAVAKPGQFTASRLVGNSFSSAKWDESFMAHAVYRALREYDAIAYQQLLKACSDAARGGASEVEIAKIAREYLLKSFETAKVRSSDQVFNRMARFWQLLADQYGATHPSIVRAVFESKPLPRPLTELLPKYPTEVESEIMIEGFNTATLLKLPVDRPKAEADIQEVLRAMDTLLPGSSEKMANLEALSDKDYVETLGVYFRCINEAIPPDRRPNLIRFVLEDM